MKVKIITGFREDQHYTIDSEEAHKAYHLFLNPEQRGVFDNGVALVGKNIQGIEPDWIATMGWNKGYEIGTDDWEEIMGTGMDKRIQKELEQAKEIAYLCNKNPSLLSLKLSKAKEQLPQIQSVGMKFLDADNLRV